MVSGRKPDWLRMVGLCVVLLGVFCAPARAGYVIRDLGTLGGNERVAYGINSRGVVVGASKIPGSSFMRGTW